MDPSDLSSFNHRSIRLSTGRHYHFVDQKPAHYTHSSTPVLLCVHGFPDFWYGWRYQIGPWVHKGYRVVVPDMLGYGDTDKPANSDEYSTKRLCADLAALMDSLDVAKFVCIGHDWGSFVVGRMALWHPERLLGLTQISVPYSPPSPVYHSIEDVAKMAPNLQYQVYFNTEKAVTDINENMDTFLNRIFTKPQPKPKNISFSFSSDKPVSTRGVVLTSDEVAIYQDIFKKSGIRAALNYYRTNKIRHEEEQEAKLPAKLRADLPALLLWGEWDSTVVEPVVRKSRKFVPRLRDVALKGKGHWLMLEAKEDVTKLVGDWLDENVPVPAERTTSKL